MRLIWAAAVLSDVGTWVQLIVVGSLVAAHTGSAVQTGLVALATFMPQGIAAPIGGLLADRFDRRRVFARALLLQASMTGLLAIALGLGVRSSGVLTVLILLGSIGGSLGQPSYSAMLPDLVPPEELTAMVSLGIYSWNSGRIIGPMVGTLLVASVGPAWTIGFNAVTFVGMSIAVSLVRRPFAPPAGSGADEPFLVRLTTGWGVVRRTPGCWHVVVLFVLFNLSVVPFMGLIPIYARREFGGGTGLAGTISSAQGIGAILGGVAVTFLAIRFRRSDLVAVLIATIVVTTTAYALAPSRPWVTAAALALGAACAAFFVTTSVIVQRDAPPASRGRVLATMQACMGVSYGIGLLTIGSIGDALGLRTAFVVGALGMAAGSVAIVRRSARWRRALDGADQPDVRVLVDAG